jgi:hypothetical protein
VTREKNIDHENGVCWLYLIGPLLSTLSYEFRSFFKDFQPEAGYRNASV